MTQLTMTQPVPTKFVSIDIETTGLDTEKCQIIEIGAVIDDWLDPIHQPPTFHCYVKQHMYVGEPYAMSMHSEIFRRIATQEDGYNYWYPSEAAGQLGRWMEENGAYQIDPTKPDREARAVVAGKNFGTFDDRFLRRLPHFDEWVKYHHRLIDPAMLFWNPLTDTVPPSLKVCMERAGLEGEVAHTALDDALVVAKLIHIAVGRQVQSLALTKTLLKRKQFNVAESHARALG